MTLSFASRSASRPTRPEPVLPRRPAFAEAAEGYGGDNPARVGPALVLASLQSLPKIAEQVVEIDWLAQEGNRSGLHSACPHVFIEMARDENNGNAMTSGDQVVLQINPTQSRHLHIGDQTRCVVDMIGVEKFVGRAKCGGVVAQRSYEPFVRLRARLHRHRRSQSSEYL